MHGYYAAYRLQCINTTLIKVEVTNHKKSYPIVFYRHYANLWKIVLTVIDSSETKWYVVILIIWLSRTIGKHL